MKYTIKIVIFIAFFVSSFSIYAEFISDPIVIAFTRHTFRGYAKKIPSVTPIVSNLTLKNNVLAYNMDATPQGLMIAKAFGERAYNNGAQLALKTIQSDPTIAGRWTIIRADLSTERTFSTAAYLREGLLTLNLNPQLTIIGCPTPQGEPADSISSFPYEAMKCIPEDIMQQLMKNERQKVASHFAAEANKFITLLGGKPDVKSDDAFKGLSHLVLLASMVEFNSDFRDFSLNDVVFNRYNPSNKTAQEAVQAALSIIGFKFLTEKPGIISDVISYDRLNYINQLPPGSQQIILTHDNFISPLLQSLGLITSRSKPSELGIYPLETVIFALNARYVAIVRTRIAVNPNGSMTADSQFNSKVIWNGTRAQWNKMVANAQNNLHSQYPAIASCIAKIPVCTPVTMNVKMLTH